MTQVKAVVRHPIDTSQALDDLSLKPGDAVLLLGQPPSENGVYLLNPALIPLRGASTEGSVEAGTER